MSRNAMVRGSIVALVTPFDDAGDVNFDMLGQLLDFHIEHKTDGILILGTTGESSTLSHDVDDDVVRFCVSHVDGRCPLIFSAGSNCTKESADKCRRYEAEGATTALVITPYYNKASDAGMQAHFETIAEASDLDLILYNVPSRTGCAISPAVAERLSQVPTIRGMKEASGNMGYMSDIAHLAGPDFSIYSGNDDIVVPMLSMGATGVISVAANIIPDQMHEMVASYLAGDVALARDLQVRYLDLIHALFCEVNPIPVKEAMRQLGMDVGGYHLPMCDPTPEHKARIAAALAAAGLTKED
ncbi:MAG: 4-hydroxy-tetrahydrodipicolinate synthase [Atopobiaceae bacterium]|nr:4-hydroxy-tetrahydrodipicolinate synthase [Atopobiaceae bacterium]MCH4214051.1 4-hydroxy-tetrahydrodipicolinate synthase [Atopobiaceae bacterium]MCH4229514.1 4-hydroxy-tetrahydrodipicolinate synthase [Atopobiaceae bacterium]MCH4276403.1 4-hydroxy-tetrahydrodipicolinate synthase [Atopobiaceae bacterium]MCI1226490.1 4-hydroxy-tetrahydrodipicolinate synthase [Atopobiaceae bacterium]